MTQKAKNIIFQLQECKTTEELFNYWDECKKNVYVDPDMKLLISVKNTMKENLNGKDEIYQSRYTKEDCEKVQREMDLPLSEKKRNNNLRIKKLKYLGILNYRYTN